MPSLPLSHHGWLNIIKPILFSNLTIHYLNVFVLTFITRTLAVQYLLVKIKSFNYLPGLEPILSNLLINARHGTLYRFICLFTVKVWLCTPPTAQSTKIAPSSTLNARSTSTVKSTWPGVSIMFILWSFQIVYVAADWMVIPLWRSSSIESITAPTLSLPFTYRIMIFSFGRTVKNQNGS